MSKPDWKDAPEWANWLAQDKCGEWFWYEYKPDLRGSTWSAYSTAGKLIRAEIPTDVPTFIDTLERRP